MAPIDCFDCFDRFGNQIASDIGDRGADVNASAIECPDVGRFNMADGFGTTKSYNC